MSKSLLEMFYVIFLMATISIYTIMAAPLDLTDDEDSFISNSINGGPDYNTVMGHFKDFMMYLPVMMTSFKETMTGFPKFAEGIRILTSATAKAHDDCKCNSISGESSKESENTSHYV